MSASTCTSCGCTDLRACPGGCSWLGVNHKDGTGVCSRCPKALTAWRSQQAGVLPQTRAAQRRAMADELLARETQPDLIQIGPTDI